MDDDLSSNSLQSSVNQAFGIRAPVNPPAQSTPQQSSPQNFPLITPDAQNSADRDRIAIIRSELEGETNPAKIASGNKEISDTQDGINQRIGNDDLDPNSLRSAVNKAFEGTNGPASDPVSISGTSSSPIDKTIGAGEQFLRIGSGFGAVPLSGLASIYTGLKTGFDPDKMADTQREAQNYLTYKPITDAGIGQEKYLNNLTSDAYKKTMSLPIIGDVSKGYNELSDKVADYSPLAGTVLASLPRAALSIGLPEVGMAERSLTSQLMRSGENKAIEFNRVEPSMDGPKPINSESMPNAANDASTTANKVNPGQPALSINNASPELQKAVADANAKGLPINQTALNRHMEAEKLPVPVQLSDGEASGNAVQISEERNSKGGNQPLVTPDFINEQTSNVAKNLDVIRDKVAPDIPSAHTEDYGQQLVDSYKKMDAPVVADITSKYKARQDANGGQFPIDTKAFLDNTQTALKQKLKSNHLPPAISADLADISENGMDFEKFEAMRTNLSNEMRSNTNGNAKAAAGIVRDQLESIPLTPEASGLKDLADQARSAAKTRFDKIKSDPAYKAVDNDNTEMGEPSPLANTFTKKYVTGATVPLSNIKTMKSNLSGDSVANQTISAATMDELKSASGADPVTGKFASDSYNKRLASIKNKMPDLVGDEAAQQLNSVGYVAQARSNLPAGNYANTSNTLVAAGGRAALSMIRGVTNAATLGTSEKVINGTSNAVGIYQKNKAIQAATAPGAGITRPTRLSDLGGN